MRFIKIVVVHVVIFVVNSGVRSKVSAFVSLQNKISRRVFSLVIVGVK
jgi:hypothetical protein